MVIDEATLTTEETWTFRAFGSRLFVPFVDPQGGVDNPENGQYAVASTPGTWATVTNVTPVPQHVMDVIETADGLFLFGANGTGAQVWQSTDDGATWTNPLTVANADARFYGAMLFGSTIVTVSWDGASEWRTFRWDAGGPFTEIQIDDPLNFSVSDPVPFTYNGTAFHLVLLPGKAYGYKIEADWWIETLPEDAAQREAIAASIPANAYDATVTGDGSTMYLLDDHVPQRVWRGDAAGAWSVVLTLATTDPLVVCMAVDEANGWLYFGSKTSQILRHVIPA